MEFVNVITDTVFINSNKSITSDCFAITFIVPSDCEVVNVNGYPIQAGTSYTISQSQGYIDRTRYEITFASAGATNGAQLYIVRVVPQFNINPHS